MDRNIAIVAHAFYAAAAALGVPSTVGFLFAGFEVLRTHLVQPPQLSTRRSPDGVIRLLEIGAHIFGKAAELIGAAGEWIITVLAVVFFCGLLFAAALFFTGRGLHGHQGWARVLASLFALGLLLTSVVGVFSIRRSPVTLVPLFAAAASVYVLWALWRRFA